MKTERLKDDADASKGFVISFDDEPAKKAKPPALKVRRPSKKFSSASGLDLNSDGSSSSRKENVPPELMICIDMNMGSDEGAGGGGGGGGAASAAGAGATSPSRRKYVSSTAIGYSPGATRTSDWKSYADQQTPSSLGGQSHVGQPANDPDELTPTSSGDPIPKFAVDPNVPLEEMTLIGHASEESEGDGRTTGLLIGDELVRGSAMNANEMERKKERIMMASLRRRQEAEDAKRRKEVRDCHATYLQIKFLPSIRIRIHIFSLPV